MRLRFVAHPGIFTIATRIAQYGFWATHVEAELSDGHYISAMFKDGVQIRNRDYDKGKFLKEEFINIEMNSEQETKFNSFLISQINKPYDVWAVASFVFADWFNYCREWEADDSWYCSEFQTTGLVEAGWLSDRFVRRANHVSVRDLYYLVTSRVEVK